jgi:carboxylesterase type B
VITQEPLDAFAKGDIAPVPLVQGVVHDEGIFFVYEAINSTTIYDIEYDAILAAVFRTAAFQVHSMYPPTGGDNRPLIAQLLTDYLFACPSRYLARGASQSAATGGHVWLYEFNHVIEEASGWGKYTFCSNEVCHGSELPFVFDSARFVDLTFAPDETELAWSMSEAWGAYAHNLDPNTPAAGIQQWPTMDGAAANSMEFTTPDCKVKPFFRSKYCDFWDKLGTAAERGAGRGWRVRGVR